MRKIFVTFSLILSSLSCIDPPPATVSIGETDMASDLAPNNDQGDMTPGCLPEDNETFCARNDADCGDFSGVDNCGEMRSAACGSCAIGECVDDNKCDAVRAACQDLGAECGTIELEEGGEGNCGTCEAPETCGGEGVANKCGCTDVADACDAEMAECGGIEVLRCDGTLDPVDCGNCPGDKPTCFQGKCRCVPEAKEAFCQRVGKCGSVSAPDNCGSARTEDCGCEAGEICFEDACCVPESNGELCQILNPPTQDPNLCSTESTMTDRCGEVREVNCSCDCSAATGEPDPQACGGRCGNFVDDDGCNQTCAPSCSPGLVCDDGNDCCQPMPISEEEFCDGRCLQVTKENNCGQSETRGCGLCPILSFCIGGWCT